MSISVDQDKQSAVALSRDGCLYRFRAENGDLALAASRERIIQRLGEFTCVVTRYKRVVCASFSKESATASIHFAGKTSYFESTAPVHQMFLTLWADLRLLVCVTYSLEYRFFFLFENNLVPATCQISNHKGLLKAITPVRKKSEELREEEDVSLGGLFD